MIIRRPLARLLAFLIWDTLWPRMVPLSWSSIMCNGNIQTSLLHRSEFHTCGVHPMWEDIACNMLHKIFFVGKLIFCPIPINNYLKHPLHIVGALFFYFIGKHNQMVKRVHMIPLSWLCHPYPIRDFNYYIIIMQCMFLPNKLWFDWQTELWIFVGLYKLLFSNINL